MPGTQFPDALLAYDTFPPPKEAFVALLESGFTFIGSGPFGTQDIWFLKPISREGSILHEVSNLLKLNKIILYYEPNCIYICQVHSIKKIAELY